MRSDSAHVRETTLTFLFTEIEESARLWQTFPEAMRLALVRHDAILRHGIEVEGGQVFKTMGDAFYAAFAGAGSALQAAVAIQRALNQEDWGELQPFRVRMAIHSGTVESRGGDYFGRPLNRVARLLGVANGGQVLLSTASRVVAAGELPQEFGFLDLGTHQLRGLEGPERVSQLTHPDLATEFPPLLSEEGSSNLPREVSRFLGRTEELLELDRLVESARLVTLAGVGGTGKTRLAIEVGKRVRERFRDGVWLVEFASLRRGSSPATEVLTALSLRDLPGRSAEATLIEGLRERDALLILDNCEHIVDDISALVAELLKECPKLRILATSREVLALPGEQVFRVPSLSMPETDGDYSLESLARCESVQLFVDRASSAFPPFALTTANAGAVSQVCRDLDGMPLALELAAARVRVLSVETLADRLRDRFRLLTSGPRTAERRQQTLRGLIDWSYDLLSPPEKALLRTLSAFVGGMDLEAVEAVAPAANPAIDAWDVLDGLQSLVDKSLVLFDEGLGRYRLLETVRQYAWDRSGESGELLALREAHAAWALDRASELGPKLAGADQIQAADRLDLDHDNLRAAHTFFVENRQMDEAQRLVGQLALFWDTHSFLVEGAARCLEALSLGRGPWRLPALLGAGRLLHLHADRTALSMYLEALDLARSSEDRCGEAMALNGLGQWTFNALDYSEAERYFRAALDLRTQVDDPGIVASTLHGLGNLALRQDRFEEARVLFEEALDLRRSRGDRRGVTLTTGGLAQLAMVQGDFDKAERLTREVARRLSDLKIRWTLAIVLASLSSIERDRGRTIRAIALMGARNRVRELTGFPVPTAERDGDDAKLEAMREAVGSEAYAEAYRSGHERTWEGALALALSEEA